MNNLRVTHGSDGRAGFFSCSTVRLNKIIDFYNRNGFLPKVDSSLQWKKYKDHIGDVTYRFFKNKKLTEDVNIKTNQKQFPLTNSIYEEQFSDYSQLNFEQNNFFVYQYFDFSDEVLKEYSVFMDKYNINTNKTIAICYRGNDKISETNLPSHEEMIEKVDILKSKYKDFDVFLQTDEIEMYKKMKSKYPNLITIDKIKRIHNNINNQVSDTIQEDKTGNAILFLAVVKIISECSKLIVNSGNVSLWVCLYRGDSNGVYQYLNPKSNVPGLKIPNMNGDFWIKN